MENPWPTFVAIQDRDVTLRKNIKMKNWKIGKLEKKRRVGGTSGGVFRRTVRIGGCCAFSPSPDYTFLVRNHNCQKLHKLLCTSYFVAPAFFAAELYI